MEVGTLFRIKGDSNIYRTVSNPSKTCEHCCACGKDRLCQKMPFCCGAQPVCFERLSSYEVRKTKKSKEFINFFES